MRGPEGVRDRVRKSRDWAEKAKQRYHLERFHGVSMKMWCRISGCSVLGWCWSPEGDRLYQEKETAKEVV